MATGGGVLRAAARAALTGSLVASLLVPAAVSFAAAGDVTRVSTDSSNAQVTGGDSLVHTWENGIRAVSDDGRYVVFESEATNLVAGDTLGNRDIFRKDRTTGAVTRVNINASGTEANGSASLGGISADGRYVVFNSPASNLDQNGVTGSAHYRKDTQTGALAEVGDAGGPASINGSGSSIAFTTNTDYSSSDTNGTRDIYRWTEGSATPALLSIKTDGTAGDGQQPSIDTAGDTVAFFSSSKLLATDTNNLSDVYVNDGGSVSLLTAGGDDNSQQPSISGDGRYVAFTSWATNLTSDAIPSGSLARIYLHDRDTGSTILISKKTDGTPSTLSSGSPVISRDGSVVVFRSGDPGLVASDGNGGTDIFMYTVADGTLTRVSTASDGTETCCAHSGSSVSGDGAIVVFASNSASLASGDTNTRYDVFAKEFAVSSSHQLDVSKAGTGSGTVTSAPGGISCGTDCTESYGAGTPVTLTAQADPGSEFTGWSGACTGTELDCDLTMDDAKSVTATFAPANHLLSISLGGLGTGEVTSAPTGIDCPADCTQTFVHNTPVTLTAEPTGGSTFGGWTGACSGTSPSCNLTMTQARSVGATFLPPSVPTDPTTPGPTEATLTVFKLGDAAGSLKVGTHGCTSSCNYVFPYGTSVTITALPGEATKFTWTGCESVAGEHCTVTMAGSRSVSAEFVRMTIGEYAQDAESRGLACSEIGQGIRRIYSSSTLTTARALATIGCSAVEIAGFLRTAAQADYERAAQILRNVGFGPTQLAQAGNQVYTATPREIGGVLKGLGYVARTIGNALKDGANAGPGIVGRVLVGLDFAISSVGETLRSTFSLEGGGIAKLLVEIGVTPAKIADALDKVFQDARVGGIGGWLREAGLNATEIARALKNGIGATATQVATALKNIGFDEFEIGGVLKGVFSRTPSEIGKMLRNLGYDAREIAEVLKQRIGLAAERVADVLYNGMGYAAETVGRAVRGAFNVGINRMATIFEEVGAGAGAAARALGEIYSAGASSVAAALEDAGYGIVEMARAIKNVFGLGYNALYNLLRSLGFSISQVVDALEDLF